MQVPLCVYEKIMKNFMMQNVDPFNVKLLSFKENTRASFFTLDSP